MSLCKIFIHTGCLTAMLSLPALAQNPRLQIQQLEKLAAKASEVVDVTMEGPTLKMATKFLENDPETKGLITNLKGIFVKVFEFDQPGAYSKEDVEAIKAQLQPPAWSRMVGVQSKRDGDVGVYVMNESGTGNILGLAILVADTKELVVVNLVGSIDIEKLSTLEGKLGIPKLTVGKGKAPKKSGGRHE